MPPLKAASVISRANDRAVWPWQAEPYKLWSLLDMIETFLLADFGAFAGNFERAIVWAEMILEPPPDVLLKEDLLERGRPEYQKALEGLLRASPNVPLSYPVSQMLGRFVARLRVPVEDNHAALVEFAKTMRQALIDDFASHTFLSIDAPSSQFYSQPLAGWDAPIERFGCAFDIEEGRKCFALGRYTAAVFHLMKVVEAAVLELQVFLDKQDLKAHFGSVIGRLEQLTQKTEFKDIPEHLRPYYVFMRSTLAQLHAVKDSWRNKVTHVDALIVADTFTEELARGVHDATLLLMKKLAEGLPPKAATT